MSLIIIFTVSCVATYLFIKVANAIGLLAYPDQHRHHEQATPLLGGLAIFIGIVAGAYIVENNYVNLLPSLLLVCVVGLLDDRFKLPSIVRFLAQAVAAYLMIKLTGVELIDLGQLVSDETVTLGYWSTPLTIFAVIGVINALNMSDGLDGLAGSLVILVLFSLFLNGSSQVALITVTMASIFGFLVWNLRLIRLRARIFMGDAGSTTLGLLVAYLLIDATQQVGGTLAPVSALWLLALPLFDAVAVLLIRPLRGKSPFKADRIHYHHLLKDMGLSINQVLLVVLLLQSLLILIGLSFSWFNIAENIQFVLFLFLFLTYFLFLFKRTS